MSTLIDMLMRNTCRAVHNRYNKLKRRKLMWEQFLSEVTAIDDKSQGGTLPETRTREKGSVVPPRTLIRTAARSGTMGCLHVLRTSEKN